MESNPRSFAEMNFQLLYQSVVFFCAFLGREYVTSLLNCSTNLVFEPHGHILNQIPDPLEKLFFHLCINLRYIFCAFLGRECSTCVIKFSTILVFDSLCKVIKYFPDFYRIDFYTSAPSV